VGDGRAAGSGCADVDECASAPCQHGGACLESGSQASVAAGWYTCRCASGYGGEACETDVDACASAPCAHGAPCTDAPAGYGCACRAGFAGEDCEVCHSIIQPLVELYRGCMVVLKVS
jgi:Notch-like protein